MTPFKKVFAAFLPKILEDEWSNWTPSMVEADMLDILLAAIPYFKFPRVSLDYDDNGFFEDLNNEEIQILACYMKCEWLNRSIMTWENIKPLYEEKDFSQANLLDKFKQLLVEERGQALKLESVYYRSIHYRPYDYTQLASRTS